LEYWTGNVNSANITLPHPIRINVSSSSGVPGAGVTFVIGAQNDGGDVGGIGIDIRWPTNVLTTPACSLHPDTPASYLLTKQAEGPNWQRLLVHNSVFPNTPLPLKVISCSATILAGAS